MAIRLRGGHFPANEGFMKRLLAILAVLTAALWCGEAPAGSLLTGFCPAGGVHSYPLSSMRRLNSLLLHNAVIVNRGTATIALTSVDIQLLSTGAVMEEIH